MSNEPATAPPPASPFICSLHLSGLPRSIRVLRAGHDADNIEHVISYWMVFQKFHSPALGGFAVLSHWLPFLFFSVAVGGLADRIDPRRIIQCGMLLFVIASVGWGYFFITDTLEMWSAMVLLVIHGSAGVLWQTPNQLLLYDIVGQAHLPSAVRAQRHRALSWSPGRPAVGGAIMLWLGPSHRHHPQHAVLPANAVLAHASADAAGRHGSTASRRSRSCRHCTHHPRHRGLPDPDVDDAAGRPDIVSRRQRLSCADAGIRDRPRSWRPGRLLQCASRRRCGRRASRGCGA